MWDRTIEVMGGTGVITQADEVILALFCEAYATWRNAKDVIAETGPVLIDDDTGRAYKSPYVAVASEAASQLHTYGSSLGLNPAARAKLAGIEPEEAGIPCRDRSKGPSPATA